MRYAFQILYQLLIGKSCEHRNFVSITTVEHLKLQYQTPQLNKTLPKLVGLIVIHLGLGVRAIQQLLVNPHQTAMSPTQRDAERIGDRETWNACTIVGTCDLIHANIEPNGNPNCLQKPGNMELAVLVVVGNVAALDGIGEGAIGIMPGAGKREPVPELLSAPCPNPQTA